MTSHLCLSVRFLDPAFHGRRDGGEPEWPPSPLRLFQALVAAAAMRWREQAFRDYAAPALGWLERQVPPAIIAPLGESGQKYRLYVPDNVADKVGAAWSRGATASIADYRTEKDVRPIHLRGGDTVHYLWPWADSDADLDSVKKTLCTATRSITHLGWGIDMAVASAKVISKAEADKLPGERWLPTDDRSAVGYRVPHAGTLQALADRHEAFLQRLGGDGLTPVPPLSAFRIVGYRRATDPPSRRWAAFAFYQPDANKMRSFPAARATAVAGMVRCMTGKMARQTGHCAPSADLDQWVNDYIMGHSESQGLRPRFSYLPLPTIRPPNILGDIRRVIIAEPPGGAGLHAAWAHRVLRGQLLLSDQQREEALLLSLRPDDGVLPRYTGMGDNWATVTPVVLPGSDDGKFAKTEKLFAKALRHAGYSPDALADYDFRQISFWPGGDSALSFMRPHYLKKEKWSVYHMRLRWRQPVKGPLAIGAGRHCGLGVFAAAKE